MSKEEDRTKIREDGAKVLRTLTEAINGLGGSVSKGAALVALCGYFVAMCQTNHIPLSAALDMVRAGYEPESPEN